MRVRIAGEIHNTSTKLREDDSGVVEDYSEDEGSASGPDDSSASYSNGIDAGGENGYGISNRRSGKAESKERPQSELCENGREALARIGRVKRLNLGVKEKVGFVQAWSRNRGGN